MRFFSLIIVFFVVAFISCVDNGNTFDQDSFELFSSITTSESGITFRNDITEDLTTKANLFDFDYFYNGAGVGVADFNNDGYQDIVFASNQGENELYVNNKGLRFAKIALPFGDQSGKKWSNGISIADINGDGFQDIYISQGGPYSSEQRKNLLYINNGDLTFTESAESYGLADRGISTQAAFFDYDQDGDLDCIVVNESEYYGLDPIRFYQAVGENEKIFWKNSSHLYENKEGSFVDITSDAGILKPSFGLGLSICDINDDGWLDIYIANDYYIPDAMYINNRNGGFTDEIKVRTSHLSFYGMGVDIADINNDGLEDIFVLDMASSDHYRSKTLMKSMNVTNFRLLVQTLRFPFQYMFNSLQLNKGEGKYGNISHLAGVAKTDWSWSVLMNDYDLDGNKDIFITNGYRRYALDNDFQAKVLEAKEKYNGNVPLDVKRELYKLMPTEPLANVLYKNNGDLSFQNITESSISRPTYSIGAATADFDNDGDLDIVINNIDDEALIMRNNSADRSQTNYLKVVSSDPSNQIRKVSIHTQDNFHVMSMKSVRGYMSSSQNLIHFGLGNAQKVDSMLVDWNNGTSSKYYNLASNQVFDPSRGKKERIKEKPNQKIYLNVSGGIKGLDFVHSENYFDDFENEILLPYKQSTLGPKMVVEDIDNDGLDDVLILNSIDKPNELFIQTESGFERTSKNVFERNKNLENLDAVFFDLNGDGLKDIYMTSGGNEKPENDPMYKDKIFINQGDHTYVDSYQTVLENGVSGKVVKAVDFDGDGDEDLVIGNRIIPQKYPQHASSLLLENRSGVLVDVTENLCKDLLDFGIVNDIEISDINDDGKPDLIVLGEWTTVGVFINENNAFKNASSEFGLDKLKGWWFSISSFDANQDGVKDYVFGNIGLNSKYSASLEKPLKVYAGDLDNNDTWDFVLSKKYKNEYVPLRGKECSSEQMPFIKEKFPTYDLFASASIDEVYGDELNHSLNAEVNTFASYALMSNGSNFEIQQLPNFAQLFPIMDGIELDGSLLIAGGIFNTEVETPRFDAGSGSLLSYTNGHWEVRSARDIGLDIHGNVKDLDFIYHEGLKKSLILAAKNNSSLGIFTERE